MSFSIFDATVPNYRQTLKAVAGFMEKGKAFCKSSGLSLDDMVEATLIADMKPFRFQIVSVAHHSAGAIEGVRRGEFSPPPPTGPLGYEELQGLVQDASSTLEKVTAEELNALAGRTVTFKFGNHSMPFTVENFLLSFSFPNFYFHATTAYDLLRAKGAPLGKGDYLGAPRIGV